MDKVLIVDGDSDFNLKLKTDLEKLRQFDVLTAIDGKEALSCLKNHRISVFVCDIQTPEIDCLELLSYMTRHHSSTPCIVMNDWGKPWFRNGLAQQTFLYHLEKPFSVGTIASAIFVGLNLRDEGLNRQGMTMASLLPLIDLQQKTCRMEITSADAGKAYLYFEKGTLFDAHYNDLTGEKAAREISTWRRIQFKISELPRHRTRKRVKTHIMDIADASWAKAEATSTPETAVCEIPEKEPVIPLKEEATPFDIDWDKAGNLLQSLLNDIKTIEGYLGFALVDSEGKILASDQNKFCLNMRILAKDLPPLFLSAQRTADRINIERTDGLILNSRNCNIVMQFFQMNLFILIVCQPAGNWFEMKRCLDQMLAQLN